MPLENLTLPGCGSAAFGRASGSPVRSLAILITHESSGVAREAWRALGHDAHSCDLQAADDGSPNHYQCDWREAVRARRWDMIGTHPMCTFMCGSGIHWNDRGRGWEKTEQSLAEVREIMALDVPWYLENPVGIISTRIRPPDQTIQPYEFGEDASKRTCLWLHGLPTLWGTERVPGRMVEWPRGSGRMVERWSNQTDSGQNKLPPSEDRWKERSRTYAGIAAAMADQWGRYLANDQAQTRHD